MSRKRFTTEQTNCKLRLRIVKVPRERRSRLNGVNASQLTESRRLILT